MKTHVSGFPRIGANRELKYALESFWKGKIQEAELLRLTCEIKRKNWQVQYDAGLSFVATGDFSLYDHVLDTIVMLGVVPRRFSTSDSRDDPDTYFSMARGNAHKNIPAMEMTKWFNKYIWI